MFKSSFSSNIKNAEKPKAEKYNKLIWFNMLLL